MTTTWPTKNIHMDAPTKCTKFHWILLKQVWSLLQYRELGNTETYTKAHQNMKNNWIRPLNYNTSHERWNISVSNGKRHVSNVNKRAKMFAVCAWTQIAVSYFLVIAIISTHTCDVTTQNIESVITWEWDEIWRNCKRHSSSLQQYFLEKQ
jgi:hypothetical protein